MSKHKRNRKKATKETRWAIEELELDTEFSGGVIMGRPTGMILNIHTFPITWVPNHTYEATFPTQQGAVAYAQEFGVVLGKHAIVTDWEWEF